MINLRYHVVSLIAVFLALGMGIVMGSTVIDRVTVDALNSRLEEVRRSVNGVRDENRTLADQVRIGQDFAQQSQSLIVSDRLVGVPVVIVAVTGVDRGPVDSLRQLLEDSGAELGGTIWVLPRMRLEDTSDLEELARLLDLPPVDADTMRRLSLARLVGDPATAAGSGTLSVLAAAGYMSFDPSASVADTAPITSPTGSAATTTTVATSPADPDGEATRPAVRYVVISGAGAQVGDDLLAVPLAQALAATTGRGVAVEAGTDTPGGRGVYVSLLRGDADVASRLSTVDNLESPVGQVATVIAIEELVASRVGHYGVGPGADRLVPGFQAR